MTTEQKVTRKLRAILSADVKGYSLLMANDEASTIQILKKYRKIMAEKIKHNSGRVVDAVGDNLLAEFSQALWMLFSVLSKFRKNLSKEIKDFRKIDVWNSELVLTLEM